MTEIELLQDQIRALEARLVALEQAVRVLQGHAVDEVVAPDFDGLWRTLVRICPPDQWDDLRSLYRAIVQRWGPDDIDDACSWLNGPVESMDYARPIDLIKRGEVRRAEDALTASIQVEASK